MPALTSGPSAAQNTPRRKLGGYDFYREVLGSPKYVVAPMVDQSELAWRKLSRRYGAQLVYTPMINAKMYAGDKSKAYRETNFNLTQGEEGGPEDRPLIIQFCANDPDQLLTSALALQGHCDAVDINLGCPQDIAKKGRYGCWLQDNWDLIYKMINTLHENLSVPVTAKFRVFPTVEKTVEYAKMLERAGAQILTCHGRTREQRGHNSGLADWAKIRAVKEAVSVPVFANGNVMFHSDIERCLRETGCDAVMSAEGNLYNPTIFLPSSSSSFLHSPSLSASDADAIATALSGTYRPHADLALEYLDIVTSQKTRTSFSAIKGHLFKLMRPALARERDLREKMGRIRSSTVEDYVEVVKEMKARMERDMAAAGDAPLEQLVTIEPTTGLPVLPHWLAQPYWRPLPKPKEAPPEAAAVEQEATPASKRRIEEAVSEGEGVEESKKARKDVVGSTASAIPGPVVAGDPLPVTAVVT
ncbi:Dus-domain-containing protein [Gloeophyllum trabeum ATCC 11539]|uniref:tRNA-dihydrouridine(16/17) synthase [NAD(P)(+)] n=1 Tax=Gloeophyllum trabeum (strain ATCC 11539 / FP-39264 / Madison 617) TaxID=670483 RepID=S7QKM1_GLOTA|nr:Dus-domain-containing protein [Gloeophyllum trabeum ATCC 11539]EPQ59942.1 Dus-domain-containing protein [Gloeophyllum trabeum ATCC 11539]